jgi:superfamily II DNA or RNA helicase
MTASTLTLRPYQQEALARIDACEGRGVRAVLGVAATGLGKTVMFGELIRRRGGRALVLVHRDELVNQAIAKLVESQPDRPVTPAAHTALQAAGRHDLADEALVWTSSDAIGIVKAAADDVGSDVIVASVQTLARQHRLARLAAVDEPFHTVVVDEAHHAKADSYVATLQALRAGEADGPLLLGVTATPERGDGQGLHELFEEVAFNYDILWGIRSGYLSDLRARQIVLRGFDERSMKVSRGDYTAGSAGRALEDADAPRHIVGGWLNEAADRKTLVFTPTVALAQEVCDHFQRAGVRAAWVSGETPTDERRDLLGRFSSGDLQVMVNCAVLTEGYDEPSIGCIVVARPTKSQALYVQMVGRGTRRHPDKTDCLVLDVVGATEQHSLITIPTLFGLGGDPRVRDGEKTLSEGVADHEAELIEQGRLAARDAELFKAVSASSIAWVSTTDKKYGRPGYCRPLGSVKRDGAVKQLPTVWLVRRDPAADDWLCGLEFDTGAKRVLIDHQPLERAMAVGEDFVRKAPTSHLTAKDASWRKRRPSASQLDLCRRMRVQVPHGATAGEVSDLLSARMAKVPSRYRRKQ